MQGNCIRIKEKRPDIEMIGDIETIGDKKIIEIKIIIIRENEELKLNLYLIFINFQK